MNRRNFLSNLAGIGLFSILPGAGRIWVARRDLAEVDTSFKCIMVPPDHLQVPYWYQTAPWICGSYSDDFKAYEKELLAGLQRLDE